MPKYISPIKKRIVKECLLKNLSAREALRTANYSEGHIRRSTKNKIVRDSIAEIMTEADKRGIIDKAWKVVEDDLKHKKYKHSIAGALALKDITEKRQIDNVNPDKVIISYVKDNATQGNVAINRGTPQDSVEHIGNDSEVKSI